MPASRLPWRVTAVEALADFRLRVRFFDGTEGVVSIKERIFSSGAGVFAALSEPSKFAQAYVQHGAVTWPGEIDLAPDAMYRDVKNNS